MSMLYDFVLFEDLYNSVNHYKDVDLIAKLLKDSGYRVAIADVFREGQFCKQVDIPILDIKNKPKLNLSPSVSRFSLFRVISNLFNKFLIDLYLIRVVKQILPITKNIYIGAMYLGMPYLWLRFIPRTKNVFLWGLRSYYLDYYKYFKLKYETINSWCINRYIRTHKNVKFFVSDDIIMQEFIDLGIEKERIVLRPERVIEKMNEKQSLEIAAKEQIKLLCIGTLRPQKRLDLIIEAIQGMKTNRFQLIVAGKASSDYGYDKIIEKLCQNNPQIIRIDRRLTEDEYNNLIMESDYLVLCDEKQMSSITNGTMNEALIAGIPIIAPNYNPYKSIIEEYGVGILYDLNNNVDIQKAIERATSIKRDFFLSAIRKYQSMLLYDNVLDSFKKDIKSVLMEK